MPDRVRWWTERTNAFVEEKSRKGEWAESTTETYRGVLRVVQRHLTLPGSLPPGPAAVGSENVRHLRESAFAPNTLGMNLVVLREFLRWEKNHVAEDEALWRFKKIDLGKRRWLSPAQATALWNAATPEERVPIGLMLFAGLRRIEVRRLRVRDLNLAVDGATATVCGKGQKWRTVPLSPVVWAALRAWTADKAPGDRVWPTGKNGVDRALYAAGRRSGAFGIRPNGTPEVSNHDLRRTFIRLTLGTGKVNLWDVAHLVGHASVDMTVHYAGLDREKAFEAGRALEIQLGLAPGNG